MAVYVLIREDRNDHGYIDTSVIGIFHDENDARQCEVQDRTRARQMGLCLDDEESSEIDWQVSWKTEEPIVG